MEKRRRGRITGTDLLGVMVICLVWFVGLQLYFIGLERVVDFKHDIYMYADRSDKVEYDVFILTIQARGGNEYLWDNYELTLDGTEVTQYVFSEDSTHFLIILMLLDRTPDSNEKNIEFIFLKIMQMILLSFRFLSIF